MNLQQLRSLAAIVQSDLSISAAARSLGISQSGISNQLDLLEQETGIVIFHRDGTSLKRVTPAGSEFLGRAMRILDEVAGIERISADARNDLRGTLSLGTTHMQARYLLPAVLEEFRERYPDVQVDLQLGTSEQVAAMAKVNQLDFVLLTGPTNQFANTVCLPVYRWAYQIIVPREHPLASTGKLTLEELARHPIITYDFSVRGKSSLLETFERARLRPQIAMTARDADVIKTYVRRNFGAGIIGSIANEPERDTDLKYLDAGHLFPVRTTWIGFRRATQMRHFMYDFLEMLMPHVTRTEVNRALLVADPVATRESFARADVPLR